MPELPDFPTHREHDVPLSGGTTLRVRDFGPADAHAVVYHHGTPSCSLDVPAGWGRQPVGLRIVTFDRPGYGASTTIPGRLVADAGEWSERIADALGIGRFALMGTSGGGPHAAAAAAVLTDRITRLCVSVGLGPVGLEGFDWRVGSPPETVAEMECAIRGEEASRAFIEEQMRKEDPLAEWMDQVPASDREVLGRPEVAAEEAAVTEGAIGGGIEGWLEDDLAFFNRDWGVALGDVTADTLLVYGDADAFVPHRHGDAVMQAIGHGELVKVPGGGHYMRDLEPAMLRWLAGVDDRFDLPRAPAREVR
jgi:pimeloyl-ACP methyl ester carboxylesterase